MEDKLYEILMKLPRSNLINLMWNALSNMQAYNGRTRAGCILESMGVEALDDEKTGRFKYKLPKTIKEIKKNTENMGF